jgi:hypothetical protein
LKTVVIVIGFSPRVAKTSLTDFEPGRVLKKAY